MTTTSVPGRLMPAAWRRTVCAIALALAAVLAVSSCGSSASTSSGAPSVAGTSTSSATSCPSSNTKAFAKTKFVLHAGLAFGTFHRYIYKPYKAGTFKKGAKGRITAFVKAGATALFIKREVRLASEDVKANPTLCKAIAAPLAKVGDAISGAVSKAKDGDTSGVEDVNSQIGSISKSSGSNGATITESTDGSAG